MLQVLRLKPGDGFDAGVINGPRGRGLLEAIGRDGALSLSFRWGSPPTPLAPIHLLVGLPRPQTARDILREATALGVRAMEFVHTGRGEPSYARSTLWATSEWEAQLLAGAAQAFTTLLPAVTHGRTLGEGIAALPAGFTRIALDNYEAPAALSEVPLAAGAGVVLAIGSERGWTPEERALLRQQGFRLAHLGERVLRTETAVIAAIAIVKARLGLS